MYLENRPLTETDIVEALCNVTEEGDSPVKIHVNVEPCTVAKL